jgi:hypothetical protein
VRAIRVATATFREDTRASFPVTADPMHSPFRAFKGWSSRGDDKVMQQMNGRRDADHWLDLVDAAQLVGVTREVVAQAVLDHELRAINHHPSRPGEWLVLAVDVQLWADRVHPPVEIPVA